MGNITDHQLQAIDLYIDSFANKQQLIFRIRGGAGLIEHAALADNPLWQDAWIAMQQKHGFKVLWGISSNKDRSIEAELNLLEDVLAKGMQIDALYLSNEQYLLSKYNTTVTAYLKWCNDVLATFSAHHNFKYLINCSPEKGTGQIKWNDAVIKYKNESQYKEMLWPDLHVYVPNGIFKWEVFDKLQSAFGNKEIWVTEYGAREDVGEGVPSTVAAELDVAVKIEERLKGKGVMMSHMFANNYKYPGSEQAWVHNLQWQPKGLALKALLHPDVIVPPIPTPKVTLVAPMPVIENKIFTWKQELNWSDKTKTIHSGGMFTKFKTPFNNTHIGKTADELGLK